MFTIFFDEDCQTVNLDKAGGLFRQRIGWKVVPEGGVGGDGVVVQFENVWMFQGFGYVLVYGCNQ